jgi:hypothetical protein
MHSNVSVEAPGRRPLQASRSRPSYRYRYAASPEGGCTIRALLLQMVRTAPAARTICSFLSDSCADTAVNAAEF